MYFVASIASIGTPIAQTAQKVLCYTTTQIGLKLYQKPYHFLCALTVLILCVCNLSALHTHKNAGIKTGVVPTGMFAPDIQRNWMRLHVAVR